MRPTLTELFLAHEGRISNKWEQYLSIYDHELAGFREAEEPARLVEIGVQNGGSLELWAKFLPPGSTILGIDVDPECAKLTFEGNVEILTGDATDPAELDRLLGDRQFDIVIDDGSHRSRDISATFRACFSRVAPGGLYLIEDLHASHRSAYGTGLRAPGAALEWLKGLVDAVHADHLEAGAAPDPDTLSFLRSMNGGIARIAFYDSVAAIERLPASKEAPHRRAFSDHAAGGAEPAKPFASPVPGHQTEVLPSAASAKVTGIDQSCCAPGPEGTQDELRRMQAERDAVQAQRDAAEAERETAVMALHAAEVEREVAEAARDAAAVERDAAAAERDAARAERDAALTERNAVAFRLSVIEASTIWRVTAPLRRAIGHVPALRTLFRRAARLGWWTATGQLPARLRERRAIQARAAAVVGEVESAREPVLLLPFSVQPEIATPQFRIAVLLHAFHLDQAEEFSRRLGAIPVPFSLCISTDTEEKAEALRRHFASGPAARLDVRVMPNRGRDIAPKIVGFHDVHAEHDLVLHLHTKASTHDPRLAPWRGFILDGLLGSTASVGSILEAFARLPRLGMVAPRNFPVIRPYMGWDVNFLPARRLAARMGIALAPDSPLDFPAGSMFWARSAALAPLLEAGLTVEDFAEEGAQTDGTLAHAVERLYFYACEKAGFRWVHAGSDKAIAPPERALHVATQADLEWAVSDQMPALLLPGRRPRPTPDALAGKEEALKQAFRTQCAADLSAFLVDGSRLVFPTRAAPRVSVILVLFNQAEFTFHCLQSLLREAEAGIEVIILDNGSTDATGALLDRLDGVRVIRSPENLHFLRGVNRAAQDAQGEHILLLNNDTRVAPGAIAAAVARLDAEPDLGAVGGPIVLLDGTLQEAGSIIFRDGACMGYGRGRDPGEAEFQFRRDVDYCSGAFLMVRRSLFERLGGFDEAFAPAYYEETDLCMRIRAAGFRVGYEPKARITHVEFGSSASSQTALALQARHRDIFVQRHRAALEAGHLPPTAPAVAARLRPGGAGRVLVIDDRVPFPALGAGYPRAARILREMAGGGWSATLYPMVVPTFSCEAAYEVLPPTIEIAVGAGATGLASFLRARTGCYDAVFVSRPHNMAAYARAIREAPDFAARTPLLYDAEAIFAGRDAMRAALGGQPAGAASRAMAREIALSAGARIVLAVTETEARKFRAGGRSDSRVLGHALMPNPVDGGPEGRHDILFVGALDEDDSPNTDSLVWFVQEVMPRLDARIGTDWVLKVVGRSGAARVRMLASPRVQLLGRVEDLTRLYSECRLFVAPTRYAAGIPMKVHEAASVGIPVVATNLLAGQLGWSNEAQLLAADSPEEFAAACERLWRDDALWIRLREAGLAAVAEDCSPERFRATLLDALRDVAGRTGFVVPTAVQG
ncbi:glycosyltransferase [Roseomonas eburnea]|uniref:Glycosyltransferase n=1 Tax=Neoroseomonas eburnea TaxID=1346889 RepID=A0A9X9X741_9PROT|nr:rhamnan synthesis F family protein [Neoroseomonas eburnea]MBR0679527.1 glycosyltransferase [Neoroseomonas eburnea]